MYYFYILRSLKDQDFYYGSTSDLKRRLTQHNNAQVVATRNRLPLELVYYEAYQAESLARRRERSVKTSGSVRSALKSRIVGH